MQTCKIDAIAALLHKIIHIRKMQKSYYQIYSFIHKSKNVRGNFENSGNSIFVPKKRVQMRIPF